MKRGWAPAPPRLIPDVGENWKIWLQVLVNLPRARPASTATSRHRSGLRHGVVGPGELAVWGGARMAATREGRSSALRHRWPLEEGAGAGGGGSGAMGRSAVRRGRGRRRRRRRRATSHRPKARRGGGRVAHTGGALSVPRRPRGEPTASTDGSEGRHPPPGTFDLNPRGQRKPDAPAPRPPGPRRSTAVARASESALLGPKLVGCVVAPLCNSRLPAGAESDVALGSRGC